MAAHVYFSYSIPSFSPPPFTETPKYVLTAAKKELRNN
jgi:hypothetical protein